MSNRAISSLFAAAFILAASGSAFAQASPPPPAPVYNWTGWYAGVNAGASFGDAKTDFNAPVTAQFTINVPGSEPITGPIGFAGSNREYPSGFIGGGQIGYNWQLSPIWVVGLEADFQGAIEKDSNTLTNSFDTTFERFPVGFTAVGSQVLAYQTKIDWFGTARVRIGYLWGNGAVMSYVTGGLAYGKVDLEGTNTVSAALAETPLSVTQAIGHSQINAGWTVGYGTEGVIDFWGARNWTWKVEALYMDLGTLDATGSGVSAAASVLSTPSFTVVLTGGPVTTHTHFTDGILRGGLNYKFY